FLVQLMDIQPTQDLFNLGLIDPCVLLFHFRKELREGCFIKRNRPFDMGLIAAQQIRDRISEMKDVLAHAKMLFENGILFKKGMVQILLPPYRPAIYRLQSRQYPQKRGCAGSASSYQGNHVPFV